MKHYVKNMVTTSSEVLVRSELEKLGLRVIKVGSGEVEIQENISARELCWLTPSLRKTGLEFIEDKNSVLIEKIKNAIVEIIRYSDEPLETNYSNYLSEKLKYNYTYLTNRFSKVQGTSIHKHIIWYKIELVKELLKNDDLNLTEIAYRLKYSSVAHLSNQFKKVTGVRPTHYKEFKQNQEISAGLAS